MQSEMVTRMHDVDDVTRMHDANDVTQMHDTNDASFPERRVADIDPVLIILQNEATEFITSIILSHEKKFYDLIQNKFPDKKINILGTTCKTIIDMISTSTSTYFNKLYLDCQNNKSTEETKMIILMTHHAGYGSHILLEKLLILVLEVHHDVIREELCLDNLDLYMQSVLNQINSKLKTITLIYELEKKSSDTSELITVPDGVEPFKLSTDFI